MSRGSAMAARHWNNEKVIALLAVGANPNTHTDNSLNGSTARVLDMRNT